MRVILVPGLFEHIRLTDPLRRRLEKAGHEVYEPGFKTNVLFNGELRNLLETLDKVGAAALVGHSAGGLLSVIAAQTRHKGIICVVGLGSAVLGRVRTFAPYYEARSMLEWLLPVYGAVEVKHFLTSHAMLPQDRAVQTWVIEKLENHK